jgi:hypothetical protein
MDVQDKHTNVRVTVRWNEAVSTANPRQIAIVKKGQRQAFIGSALNCMAGNPAKCNLEDDGGSIEVFRYTVSGTATTPNPTCLPTIPPQNPIFNGPLNGLKNIFGSPPTVVPRSIECMKLIMRKGELYVGSLRDSNEAVLEVDSAESDDVIFLQRKHRAACPEIRTSEDQSQEQPVQPTGEPGEQPPSLPINFIEPAPVRSAK